MLVYIFSIQFRNFYFPVRRFEKLQMKMRKAMLLSVCMGMWVAMSS
jgi:hypothetical protein